MGILKTPEELLFYAEEHVYKYIIPRPAVIVDQYMGIIIDYLHRLQTHCHGASVTYCFSTKFVIHFSCGGTIIGLEKDRKSTYGLPMHDIVQELSRFIRNVNVVVVENGGFVHPTVSAYTVKFIEYMHSELYAPPTTRLAKEHVVSVVEILHKFMAEKTCIQNPDLETPKLFGSNGISLYAPPHHVYVHFHESDTFADLPILLEVLILEIGKAFLNDDGVPVPQVKIAQ